MITAAEARQIAFSKNNELVDGQLKRVKREIIKAANQGKHYCIVDFQLCGNVVSVLQKLGDEVAWNIRFNDTHGRIDW